MNEQLTKTLDSLKSFWGKISKKTKTLIGIVAAVVIIGALILTAVMNSTKYVILYPDLDNSEAKEVVAEIESRGIDYREKDGTVYVPEKEEEALRMDLSSQGHPYSTYNYDFFLKNVDVMTTDAERKILEKYQLSQKLESVISTLDCVERASVTINLAEKSTYVLSTDTDSESSAGVTLTLKSGKELSNSQVSGIKTLVSKSVPNLEIENIAVIDNATGVELGSSSTLEVDKSTFKLAIQKQYETDIENKVKTILSKIFGGDDNVQVVAKSDIDVDKGIKEITTYTPSEDNRGVISHEEHTNSSAGDGANASGVPGTDTNTGTTTYSSISSDENTIYVDSSDSYDYLVSQIKEQIQKDSAEIVDLTISVAVNDDAMSDTKKQEILQLVANSAGVEQDKVYVYNGAFVNQQGEEQPAPAQGNIWDNKQLLMIAGIAAGALLLLLIIVLLFVKKSGKKKKKMKKELAATVAPTIDIMEDPTLENFKVGKINPAETKAQALRTQIQNFTNENPEIAAQLVRTWIKEGDGKNDQ